jgi:hypothetical protein
MPPDPFQPTWPRALFAFAVAAFGFALPQKIPLEYFSLNNPSSGLQYLEITCAADFTGEVQVSLDTGRGYNDIETIRWPVSPSDMAYTYTFPLADAPLFGMRLEILKSVHLPALKPPCKLTITHFRIINRREQEIRRFTMGDLRPTHEVASIAAAPGGWAVLSTATAVHPYSEVNIGRTLIAEGMDERNFKRCLLSWSYLSLMIWILVLAAYFACRFSGNALSVLRACAFLAFLAMLFSAVGNRGLIKNSIRYAEVATAETSGR